MKSRVTHPIRPIRPIRPMPFRLFARALALVLAFAFAASADTAFYLVSESGKTLGPFALSEGAKIQLGKRAYRVALTPPDAAKTADQTDTADDTLKQLTASSNKLYDLVQKSALNPDIPKNVRDYFASVTLKTADNGPAPQKYLQSQLETCQKDLGDAKNAIKDAKNRKIAFSSADQQRYRDRGAAYYDSTAERAAAIKEAETRVADIQQKIEKYRDNLKTSEATQHQKIVFPYLSRNPKVGDIGQLHGFTVNQVLDDNSALIRHAVDMVLRDYPTAGMVDNQGVRTDNNEVKLFEVTGTESYTAVSGARRTVFTIRPLPLEKYLR